MSRRRCGSAPTPACLPSVADSHHLWLCRSELKDTLSFTGAYETVTDGAAAEHAAPARREAAKKLIMNHERVLHDLTRNAACRSGDEGPALGSPGLAAMVCPEGHHWAEGGISRCRRRRARLGFLWSLRHTAGDRRPSPHAPTSNHQPPGTDGPPKSQPELAHGLVLMGQEHDVDIALREISLRLIGRLPRERPRRPLAPSSPEQVPPLHPCGTRAAPASVPALRPRCTRAACTVPARALHAPLLPSRCRRRCGWRQYIFIYIVGGGVDGDGGVPEREAAGKPHLDSKQTPWLPSPEPGPVSKC